MRMKPAEKRFIEAIERLEGVSEDGFPVLPAVPRRDGYGWMVWCRHCKVWHSHGIGLGHRTAHCLDFDRRGRAINSPYRERGYVLVLREEVLDAEGRAAALRLERWERAEEAKTRRGA